MAGTQEGVLRLRVDRRDRHALEGVVIVVAEDRIDDAVRDLRLEREHVRDLVALPLQRLDVGVARRVNDLQRDPYV